MNDRRRAVELGDALHRRITESLLAKKRRTLAARIDPGVALAIKLTEEENDGQPD